MTHRNEFISKQKVPLLSNNALHDSRLTEVHIFQVEEEFTVLTKALGTCNIYLPFFPFTEMLTKLQPIKMHCAKTNRTLILCSKGKRNVLSKGFNKDIHYLHDFFPHYNSTRPPWVHRWVHIIRAALLNTTHFSWASGCIHSSTHATTPCPTQK